MSRVESPAAVEPAVEAGNDRREVPQPLSLVAERPAETLSFLRDLSRQERASAAPEAFGNLTLFGGARGLEGLPRTDGGVMPPGVVQTERTRIHAVGTGRQVDVELGYGVDGRPNSLRDHLGQWRSEDGGKTWLTGEPNFHVRRGEVSIDGKGNYSITNDDFGVKTTYSRDGSWSREMRSASGATLSVNYDRRGEPTGFRDSTGAWTRHEGSWRNTETGETKNGRVSLSEFGEFKFKPANGLEVAHRTENFQRINDIQKDLTAQFGVRFMPPGALTEDGVLNGSATLDELKVMRETLEATRHVNYKDMKVWFPRSEQNRDDAFGEYSNAGRGEKHSCGSSCSHSGDRRPGGDLVMLPKSRLDTLGYDAFKGTLLHELGHHEQGEAFGHRNEWIPSDKCPPAKQLSESMGWVEGPRGTQLFLDKNGGRWRNVDGDSARPWVYAGGGTRPPAGSERLTNEQMRERALVRPMTNYFPYPTEMHAESLAMFRMGPNQNRDNRGRDTLARESPALYDAIKRYDQAAIDQGLGRLPTGESRFIRDLDGKLVPNNSHTRQRIEEAERIWKSRVHTMRT